MNGLRQLQSNIHVNPYSNRVEIRLGEPSSGVAAQPLIFEVQAPGSEWQPALSVSRAEAQGIFDEFYRAGFRPTHEVDNAGELQATRHHLADMREIAFNGLRAAGIQPKGGAA